MFSFKKRNTQMEVHRVVRRVMDTSSPNRPPSEGDERWESRSNRTIPILLTPFEDGVALPTRSVFAVTKDLSSQGVAVIADHRPDYEAILVGILVDGEPVFARAAVRQAHPLGGGFWQLGIELLELATLETCGRLDDVARIARYLNPEAVPEPVGR